MTAQIRLNRYERDIASALASDYGYDNGAARELVVRYIHVLRKLGSYDAPRDHAERLQEAARMAYSPETWLDRLRLHDADRLRDIGLPEERGSHIAYVR